MASIKALFDKFKKKTPEREVEVKETVGHLIESVSAFATQAGAKEECKLFIEQLMTLNPRTPVTPDLINTFKSIVRTYIDKITDFRKFYSEITPFQSACSCFSNYATVRQETDGSYSICAVTDNEAVTNFVVNHFLTVPNESVVEALKTSNKNSLETLKRAKINTYYGDLKYIKGRTKAILDGITMIKENYSLTPDEYQFLEIKYVEAKELASIIESIDENTITQDIYFNVVHKRFHELVQIENELAHISERIWKNYFEVRGAKFVHALTSGFVESNQMYKICTTLYLNDLATIPYGHTGYEYDFNMRSIGCICEEDVGSWKFSKNEFVGENRGGIMHNWQYIENECIFYEYGYHSKLLPPDYIEHQARRNNDGRQHMAYTEILLINNEQKIPPVKAFYTDKATPEEIEKISALAQQQGITVEYIDTTSIMKQMNLKVMG